jgi:hypothetical protein
MRSTRRGMLFSNAIAFFVMLTGRWAARRVVDVHTAATPRRRCGRSPATRFGCSRGIIATGCSRCRSRFGAYAVAERSAGRGLEHTGARRGFYRHRRRDASAPRSLLGDRSDEALYWAP